jgi:hypothetical protein
MFMQHPLTGDWQHRQVFVDIESLKKSDLLALLHELSTIKFTARGIGKYRLERPV